MTGKRFVNKGKDIFQYGEWWCGANGEHCADVIATALNELCEENEELQGKYNAQKRLFGQLNSDYNNYRLSVEDCQKQLKKESEQLKTTIQRLTNDNTKQKKKLNTIMKENEQLKKENMEYHHLVSCDNCEYHNYDWFDDGDEFEVCDRGHTERLMYNRFCKEWREFE